MLSGLVIVDKPQDWTSHDVVAKLRRLLGTRKVGHAGTLDPLATGVLVVGVNKATRLLTYIGGTRKTYTATIRLGQSTVTDDVEGEILETRPVRGLGNLAEARAKIDAAVAALTGEIAQVPSSVSAIKVKGQRSYARVRAGQDVELAARPVTVHRFDVHECRPAGTQGEFLDVEVTVECSSGTYIRALARDLGSVLGVGGHVTALRRTSVGPYRVDQARSMEEITESGPESVVLPLVEAAQSLLPVRRLSADEARELSFGRKIQAGPPDQIFPGSESPEQSPVAAIAPDGSLVALLEPQNPKATKARAMIVFADQESQRGSAGRDAVVGHTAETGEAGVMPDA